MQDESLHQMADYTNFRIAIYDAKNYETEFFDLANSSFNFQLVYYEKPLYASASSTLSGIDGVSVFVNDQITGEVINTLEQARIGIIALRSAGYNHVDFVSAYRRIHVVRVPAYSPHAVAEYTVALILALNRKVHLAFQRTRDSNFSLSGLMGFDMHGRTAGIIGTGKIGTLVAKILRGFDMQVLAYDKFPNVVSARDIGFNYVDLATLYRSSDIISLNCPLTTETFHMIDSNALMQMKNGVMIVNTGRGQLIDTKALIEGLKSRKVGSAGLDVYEEESEYFFEDFSSRFVADDVLARLLTFNNVLVTSHQGFFTREALENIAETTLKNLSEYFSGKPLTNEICYQCGRGQLCQHQTSGRCF